MPAGPVSRLEFVCGLLAATAGWAALAISLHLVSLSQDVNSGALAWSVATAALFAELAVSAVGHSRSGGVGWLVSLLVCWGALVALIVGVLTSFAVFLSPALFLGLVAIVAAGTRVATQSASPRRSL